MTAYACTGPSRLLPHERALIAPTVAGLELVAGAPTEIITGAAEGWDMGIAVAALSAWPDALHRVFVPRAPHADLEPWLVVAISLGVRHRAEAAPMRGTGLSAAYRARNGLMVAACDVLVAGLRAPSFYRSGEWMTVNIARRWGSDNGGKPVHVVDLAPRSPLANPDRAV